MYVHQRTILAFCLLVSLVHAVPVPDPDPRRVFPYTRPRILEHLATRTNAPATTVQAGKRCPPEPTGPVQYIWPEDVSGPLSEEGTELAPRTPPYNVPDATEDEQSGTDAESSDTLDSVQDEESSEEPATEPASHEYDLSSNLAGPADKTDPAQDSSALIILGSSNTTTSEPHTNLLARGRSKPDAKIDNKPLNKYKYVYRDLLADFCKLNTNRCANPYSFDHELVLSEAFMLKYRIWCLQNIQQCELDGAFYAHLNADEFYYKGKRIVKWCQNEKTKWKCQPDMRNWESWPARKSIVPFIKKLEKGSRGKKADDDGDA
ncbi:hypothetical protein M501DRAFT_166440 [Patellaria atrata CBS 101060]|uniref:Uncharacterized protein n=1 Tax=Patellaria atrata CBS 101060 TaxID=1346257 RepID=A0A9P4VN79_9PEZI|nr:hypothetical protein M501DRAFT_166440 [Patellaria atrata CBS 101060]